MLCSTALTVVLAFLSLSEVEMIDYQQQSTAATIIDDHILHPAGINRTDDCQATTDPFTIVLQDDQDLTPNRTSASELDLQLNIWHLEVSIESGENAQFYGQVREQRLFNSFGIRKVDVLALTSKYVTVKDGEMDFIQNGNNR
jgi:hypothetical protein